MGKEDTRDSRKEIQLQKETILQLLKEKGCRITKQRLLLLDIILEQECSNCKEIYCKASRIDQTIGFATVYRMVNTLEAVSYTHPDRHGYRRRAGDQPGKCQ